MKKSLNNKKWEGGQDNVEFGVPIYSCWLADAFDLYVEGDSPYRRILGPMVGRRCRRDPDGVGRMS